VAAKKKTTKKAITKKIPVKKVAPKKKVVNKKPVARKRIAKIAKSGELEAMQLLFIKEFIIDLNATQAAIRAGYSEKTAAQQASRLLSHVKIQDAIQKAFDRRIERLDLDGDTVLREIMVLAFSNISDFVDWSDGAIRISPSSGIEKRKLAAVAEISETETKFGTNIKLKMHDKKGSLELLGRHLKLFTDKIEHSGNIGLTEILEDLDGRESGLPNRSPD